MNDEEPPRPALATVARLTVQRLAFATAALLGCAAIVAVGSNGRAAATIAVNTATHAKPINSLPGID